MERVLINLDEFLGKLYHGVLCLHNAPFSSPLPTRLLSSLVLSVFLSSHLSFVPFFLHSDYNGIWQDIVTSSNLLSREQEQRRWSRERRRRKREKERGIGNKKNKRNPRQTHKDTLSTQTSASEHLFSFISPFSSSVLCSPDWLVVKLMLVYRAGKGLKADTSFIACTCQYEEHTDVTFEAFSFSPINFNDMLQCSRNKVRHVQLCKPDNKHQ